MQTTIRFIFAISSFMLATQAIAAQDQLLLDQVHASKKMKALSAKSLAKTESQNEVRVTN
jgi:hypothetical protein